MSVTPSTAVRTIALKTRMCHMAVYKALKGVETVAVKSCQSLINEQEEVWSGRAVPDEPGPTSPAACCHANALHTQLTTDAAI